jgi:hypothetical protein
VFVTFEVATAIVIRAVPFLRYLLRTETGTEPSQRRLPVCALFELAIVTLAVVSGTSKVGL